MNWSGVMHTQNNNQSLNSVIWSIARKTSSSGVRIVKISSYVAPSTFNNSYKSILSMMNCNSSIATMSCAWKSTSSISIPRKSKHKKIRKTLAKLADHLKKGSKILILLLKELHMDQESLIKCEQKNPLYNRTLIFFSVYFETVFWLNCKKSRKLLDLLTWNLDKIFSDILPTKWRIILAIC